MQSKLILLRKEQKIPQRTLANLIGISLKQYSYKENGKTKFNGDEMFEIAKFFNKQIEDIFLPTFHQNGENKKEV